MIGQALSAGTVLLAEQAAQGIGYAVVWGAVVGVALGLAAWVRN